MKIFDITLTVSPELPVWPDNPHASLERIQSMDQGSHDNVSRLDLVVHTGTHVDAPFHFLKDGNTVESLPLEVLTGPALVVHLPDEVNVISAEVLEHASIPPGTLRLLLRTRNSYYWQREDREFHTDFVGVSAEGASWLMDHGIVLIGVDYLSVAPWHQSLETHQTLLKAGTVILEGADLHAVPPGLYDLYCLPVKLKGSDGAPTRAILIQ